jgi:uncharacterized protein (TIGR03437 family)
MRGNRRPRLSIGVILAAWLGGPLSGQDSSYVITTLAGSDWVGDGGPAIQALLLQSEGVALSGRGTVYFSDALSHRVREVLPDGTIRTVAGTGQRGASGDGGPATSAELNAPYGMAVDRTGALFIADLGNNRVRRVATDGTISTLVSGLRAPRNLALGESGILYISDFDAHRVYVLANGVLTTIAGTGVPGFQGDGGLASNAQLGNPAAVAVDPVSGALYIGDTANRAIRRVSQGIITTIARVASPTGMALDAAGTLHVADPVGGVVYHITRSGQTTASTVQARDVAVATDGTLILASGSVGRRVLPSGITAVIAGGGNPAFGDGGKALAARLNHPSGVAADAAGNVFVADRDNHRIRKIAPDGIITTFAGTGAAGSAGDGGPAVQAQLNRPSGVSVDAAGNLYIADTGNGKVRTVSPQGIISAGPVVAAPARAIPDGSEGVYIADESMGLVQSIGGSTITLVKDLKSPGGLVLDGLGALYFSETNAARVRKRIPTGEITDVAPGAWRAPRGLAMDAQGNLIVSDIGRQQVVRVDAAGRAVPIAGTGSLGFSGDSDAATLARLSLPWDVAIGPAGSILLADLDNNRVRQLTPATLTQSSPVILADAVNAASGVSGPLTPGMLVALRGTGIQPGEIPQTEFLFGGRPAQFLSIDNTRILVEAPTDAPSSGPFAIEVRHQGLTRVTIPTVAAAAAPALFYSNGHAAASNEDGSVNGPPNGALPGSVVAFYGTGLGIAGLPVKASIGGLDAEILYVGPSGQPGIFQLNTRIPRELTAGDHPIATTIGDISSAPVSVTVKLLPGQM